MALDILKKLRDLANLNLAISRHAHNDTTKS